MTFSRGVGIVLGLFASSISSVRADEFWAFPNKSDAPRMNKGRLVVDYDRLGKTLRIEGKAFGANEATRFQIVDNDMIILQDGGGFTTIKSNSTWKDFFAKAGKKIERLWIGVKRKYLNTVAERKTREPDVNPIPYRPLRDPIDVSEFAGYDLLVTEGYTDPSAGVPIFQQVYTHIPDDGTTDLPSFFVNRPRTINYSFWNRSQASEPFPQFTLPKGKVFELLSIAVNPAETGFVDNYAEFGINGMRRESGGQPAPKAEDANLVNLDYDLWLQNDYLKWHAENNLSPIGLMDPHQATADNRIRWISDRSVGQLLTAFIKDASIVTEGFARVYLDFEYLGYFLSIAPDVSGWNKIADVLKAVKDPNDPAWKEVPADLLAKYRIGYNGVPIALWGTKAYFAQYHEYNFKTADERAQLETTALATALDVESTAEELAKENKLANWALPGDRGSRIKEVLPSIEAVSYFGSIEQNYVQHLVHEIEVQKNLFPPTPAEPKGKRIVPTHWHLVASEVIGSPWKESQQELRCPKNMRENQCETRTVDIRPIMAPSAMHGLTAWSIFLGDGLSLWNDPWNYSNNEEYQSIGERPANSENIPKGFGHGVKRGNGVLESLYGTFPGHTNQAIDWTVLAAWQLSQPLPKKIIEEGGEIWKPTFSMDRNRWEYSGADLLAPYAEFKRIPVVRAKSFGQYHLVLATNRNGAVSRHDAWVNINGKKGRLPLKGLFTRISVLRENCTPAEIAALKDPAAECLMDPEDVKIKGELKLYPMPLLGDADFTAEIAMNRNAYTDFKFVGRIANSQGQMIGEPFEWTTAKGESVSAKTFNLAGKPPGIYIISLRNGEYDLTFAKRIVKSQ